MRIDPRFLNWGVFFILAGAIPLLIQANVVDPASVAGLWRFWPVLLIGAGLGLLLRQTPAHFVGGLVVAAVFGLIAGGLIGAGGSFDLGQIACGSGGGTTFAGQQGTLSDGGAVALELHCGEVTVSTGTGGNWSLDGSSADGTAPIVEASQARLAIRSRDAGANVPGFTERHESWRVAVPQSARTYSVTVNAGAATLGLAGSATEDLTGSVNAGSMKVDLTGTQVRNLNVSVNAGSATLALPSATIGGTLEVNAGSISFCVPPDAGLQLTTNEQITAGNNFGDRGLSKAGTVWTSSNWATAANRITLSTSANAGSFTLDPEEGCK